MKSSVEMSSPPTHLFRLSQSQLNVLETCPRKFQHIYIDQLGSPASPEQQERQLWGSRFHLLMQQRELGLPVESLVQEDAQLQRWVTALVSAAPAIVTPKPNTFRESEHCRTLTFQGYLLTVIYDLLIADTKQAQILDWKTYPKPKSRLHLAQDWQTRLYLYVLAKSSDYSLKEISMTYWFVQSKPIPESLVFTYDNTQHKATKKDLTLLLTKLTTWWQSYQQGEFFPQVAEAMGHCKSCNFAVRCQRTSESQESAITTNWVANLANIQEVSLLETNLSDRC